MNWIYFVDRKNDIIFVFQLGQTYLLCGVGLHVMCFLLLKSNVDVFFSILGQSLNIVALSVIEIYMFTFLYCIICR